MKNDRSRRIEDLFVEGEECLLGQDETGPVVVWVNKVNSFDAEEARKDGAVERGRRIAELSKPDNVELLGIQAQVNSWDLERLADNRVQQQSDKLSLAALDDIEADHKELLDRVRRGPELLADADLDPKDERFQQLQRDQGEYFRILREAQAKHFEDAKDKALELTRDQLVEDFIEAWRDRAALEGFMTEQRITELWYAMRECDATIIEWNGADPVFDHENCDHSKRLLPGRAQVRRMSDAALDKIIHVYDNLGVSAREAGNSGAPASSSASLEQPSEPEESTPSTPVETPLVAPMT
jgi:hypothetical protein